MGFILDPDADSSANIATSVTSADLGVSWFAYPDTEYQLMFRLTSETGGIDASGWLWWYRNQIYHLGRPINGAPTLLMNGWRGVADDNAATPAQLNDSTQTSWAGNTAAGCVVWVFAGPGSAEEVPFRLVTSSTSGVLNVANNWLYTHDNDTEYVVLGSDRWFEISHTIPFPPTGPPAIGVGGSPPSDEEMIAYIPQGHDLGPIWMYREYNNAGTYTIESKSINDATGGAGNYRTTLMINVQDDTEGPVLVKLEDNMSTGDTGLVSETRTPGTWAAQAAWGGDEQLGDSDPSALVNAIEYVDTNDARIAWATTRSELFAREGGAIPGLWAGVLLPELKRFASERTGHALAIFNTSLYLSLAGGLLERLTGGNTLTDVGPNKGVGMGLNRIGEIEALETYPGQLFCVVDVPPGTSGYSSVTRLTGLDNHDVIYQAGWARRIRDIKIQRIPSALAFVGLNSRIWLEEGDELVWLDLPNQGDDPITDVNYQFAAEGYVSGSRIYANLDDRQKVFSSIKVVSDRLNVPAVAGVGEPDGQHWIEPEYQLDTDEEGLAWTAVFGGNIELSPSEEIFLTNYDNDQVVTVRGRYLRVRLRLNTTRPKISPVLRALLVESLIGVPHKFSFKATLLFEDGQLDLLDQPYTDTQAWQQAGRLQEYAEQLEVFTLKAPSSTLDGAKVIISPPEMAPLAISEDTVTTAEQEATERQIGTLSLIQVILPDLGLVT